MERLKRTLLKKNHHVSEEKDMSDFLENGLGSFLQTKKILVYFVLTQGNQVEKDLLENSYQQFRNKMQYKFRLNIFPERPNSKITMTNTGLLEQIKNRFSELIKKDDDNLYFFFVLDGALDDFSFLHPESSKVQVLTVENNKIDELYEKGIGALHKMTDSLAS